MNPTVRALNIERASQTPPIPPCNEDALNALLTRCRKKLTELDPEKLDPAEYYYNCYGAPVILLLDLDDNAIHERPWSRTLHDVREFIEYAKDVSGRVLLEQDIVNIDDEIVSEAIQIEVWPRLRVIYSGSES